MEDRQIDKEGLLPIGTILSNGKYKVEGYLSSGGFGNTYVATDTAFDEKVAIKELYIRGVCGRDANTTDISISLTENQRTFVAQREKFKKEAKRLRKLSNSHIIRVHDLFDENETSYYVMDLVDGESLSQRMKRTKEPLTEQELMLILPQVLDALEAVHAEEIWHLDLKPANIMLDRKGNAILIDFGASKQLRNKDGNSLSTSSALAYTPGYAPSEQMEQNIEKFGPCTDLYALGATMYNLLTMNQPPSPSDIDEDAESALPMPDNISKKTRELIFWLMKPNRKMRPQNVEDVKQFLLETIDKPETTSKTETKQEDTEDGTLLRPGKAAEPNNNANSSDSTNSNQEKRGWKNNKLVYLIASLAVVGIGVGTATLSNCQNEDQVDSDSQKKAMIDSIAAEVVIESDSVENKTISVTEGPENMRSYTYTGEVNEKGIPDGKGKARYEKYGNIPSASYEGDFVNGVCTGNGTLTFDTGDKFTGKFEGGYYQNGTYTLSDGSYFQGSFRSSQPWIGSWYNKNGEMDADVKNGQEVEVPVPERE